jgi:microsomal dipeptidase-like Zn-dependent dipeptidase
MILTISFQRENIEDFFKIVNEKNSNNEERLREAEATLERCSSLQEEKNKEIKFLLEKINEQETLLGAVESLSEQLEKLKEVTSLLFLFSYSGTFCFCWLFYEYFFLFFFLLVAG